MKRSILILAIATILSLTACSSKTEQEQQSEQNQVQTTDNTTSIKTEKLATTFELDGATIEKEYTLRTHVSDIIDVFSSEFYERRTNFLYIIKNTSSEDCAFELTVKAYGNSTLGNYDEEEMASKTCKTPLLKSGETYPLYDSFITDEHYTEFTRLEVKAEKLDSIESKNISNDIEIETEEIPDPNMGAVYQNLKINLKNNSTEQADLIYVTIVGYDPSGNISLIETTGFNLVIDEDKEHLEQGAESEIQLRMLEYEGLKSKKDNSDYWIKNKYFSTYEVYVSAKSKTS